MPTAWRFLRFGSIGSFCLLLQVVTLTLLREGGMNPVMANAMAFAGSAQANFLLSYIYTWRDRPRFKTALGLLRRWLKFNGVVLFALFVNSAVFALVHRAVGLVIGALLAVAVSALATFLLHNFMTFASSGTQRRGGTHERLQRRVLSSGLQ